MNVFIRPVGDESADWVDIGTFCGFESATPIFDELETYNSDEPYFKLSDLTWDETLSFTVVEENRKAIMIFFGLKSRKGLYTRSQRARANRLRRKRKMRKHRR